MAVDYEKAGVSLEAGYDVVDVSRNMWLRHRVSA